MEQLTILEKLDYVLNLIKSNKCDNTLQTLKMFIRNEKIDINQDELVGILLQIQHDSYVFVRPLSQQQFIISTQGLMFIGYLEQERVTKLNKAIAENAVWVGSRNDHRLVVGTWFAGIAAALLLIWQIFLYLYPVHASYPYFFWHK